jgi:hypothetical protein
MGLGVPVCVCRVERQREKKRAAEAAEQARFATMLQTIKNAKDQDEDGFKARQQRNLEELAKKPTFESIAKEREAKKAALWGKKTLEY